MNQDSSGHIIPREKKAYNERLFKKGFRKYFHEARFFWLIKKLKKLNITNGTIIELGCHDGKILSYLSFSPEAYAGYDANWENGLDIAKTTFQHNINYQFYRCTTPADFNKPGNLYDISIAMETVEHLPVRDLESYLLKIKDSTRKYFFITIPNEKGPLVVIKYLIKKIFLRIDEPYSLKELWYVSIGRIDKVRRIGYGHKGFDYVNMITTVSKYFDIVTIEPIPFPSFPIIANFSIGIVATPKV